MLFGEDVAFGGVFRSLDLSMLGCGNFAQTVLKKREGLTAFWEPSIFSHDFAVNWQLACGKHWLRDPRMLLK